MDVFEALYTTRAMRRVSEEKIPEEIIQQMVDAAIRAPSGSNRQGWKFIVVTDETIKNQLGDAYREAWSYYIKEFYGNNADLGASQVVDTEKQDQVVRISNFIYRSSFCNIPFTKWVTCCNYRIDLPTFICRYIKNFKCFF